jgi:hypothetical protein
LKGKKQLQKPAAEQLSCDCLCVPEARFAMLSGELEPTAARLSAASGSNIKVSTINPYAMNTALALGLSPVGNRDFTAGTLGMSRLKLNFRHCRLYFPRY